MRIALGLLFAAILYAAPSLAHEWYTFKRDPVHLWSCCGGHDCAPWIIQPGEISGEEGGYRVRLSLERTRTINPGSLAPIDALVTWDRVQPSEDGAWHLCIMVSNRNPSAFGIYCLFAPPNS